MAHRVQRPLVIAALGARAGWHSPAWPSLGPWLAARLLEERERWALWLPVGIGTGIALYFALPVEPPAWLGAVLLLAGALAGSACAWRLSGAARARAAIVAIALGTVLLGFAVATLRTHLVAAPMLSARGAYEVETAQVLLVEERIRGQRLLLGELVIDRLDPERTPATIRVSTPSRTPSVQPGDYVRLRAFLMPPSPPVEPGGFDFARYAYFLRLGAVGYTLGEPEVLARAEGRNWSLALSAARQAIAERITAVAPGPAGAIGVALLVGLRGALPDRIWEEWAITGIAHLLSISGLHLAIVAGTLFFAVRVALALVPPLALRLPTKKIAALVALIGSFGYLLISGAPVPTQRSFIMTGLMLLAVMVDRNPFSMRLVAFAAMVVLILEPETLLGASFQMSFGAVVALIAAYETGAAMRRPADGLAGRLLLYVAGVALTTLIASAATTPFAIYHFSRFPTYGIVTNLVAVPLTALWVMPAGMLGLLLVPLGLDGPCFVVMASGIDVIIAVASAVAALPGAAIAVPRPPFAALAVTVLGGLWLCLWRTSWRRFGLVGVALGLLFMALQQRPDLLVDARGEIIAVRLDDGRLAISPWKRDRWITEGWLQSAGQEQGAPWPEGGAAAGPLRCDALGCVLDRAGQVVAFARRPEALEEDCRLADLVISYPRIETCPGGTPLLGPRALRHDGGVAIWLEPSGIRTRTVREARGERPWTR